MIDQAVQILQDVFGYDEFRSHQEAIISNVLRGNDSLAIMPTGGGKSLCYQIPAMIFPGLTLVVSPLISLMEDQVEQLKALGVKAAVLNSTLSSWEYQETINNIQQGGVKLLYMAPETLMLERTRSILASVRVDCLTIDEAHCISEWGHDFRPEYRQIADIRKTFPDAVCVALTATATPRVQLDIKSSLAMPDSGEFIASFNRTNLFLQISDKKNPVDQTFEVIDRFKNQSGIIYCNSRRQVDELSQILKADGCSVAPYHAGLASEERKENQSAFIRDDIQIMVATVAFGMGINKSNVRFVVHYDMPQNIESYYQQIGRAGRDGLPAYCLFLFSYGDIQKVKFFINQKTESEQRVASQHLNALIGFAETEECRRIPLLRYFGEQYSQEKCGLCDNCTSEGRPLVDVTVEAQKFLSCAYRTGQMFGAAHLIDILRGSRSKKVIERKHDQLSTYGIGTELSRQQWQYVSRNLIQKGFIAQDPDHGSLKLTPEARSILKGEQQVHCRLEGRRELSASSNRPSQESIDYNRELFELLRVRRKSIADDQNVPPYVVFSDKTLVDMSAYYPQSRESLLKMHGVGSVKFEQYGEIFLSDILYFCQQHGVEEKIKRSTRTSQFGAGQRARKVPSRTNARHVQIGVQFNEGMGLDDIQREFKVKLSTTLGHLYKFIIEEGQLQHAERFLNHSRLSPEQKEEVLRAFNKHGTERLRPVFKELHETVSYDELHLLRLYYLSQTGAK